MRLQRRRSAPAGVSRPKSSVAPRRRRPCTGSLPARAQHSRRRRRGRRYPTVVLLQLNMQPGATTDSTMLGECFICRDVRHEDDQETTLRPLCSCDRPAHLRCLAQLAMRQEEAWSMCPTCKRHWGGPTGLQLAEVRYELWRCLLARHLPRVIVKSGLRRLRAELSSLARDIAQQLAEEAPAQL